MHPRLRCSSILLITSLLLCSQIIRAGDNPLVLNAVRVTAPPTVDGFLNDTVWQLARPATDFIQRDPEEGKPASERSEIRVLYDNEALYFGCMFYDSEPGKIVARLARRDDEIESDQASIRLDSYHDHQTAAEFWFNAAGVKADIIQYDDGNREDASWDPVWDLQTRITPHGWTAELRIPFGALRYRTDDSDTTEQEWGLNIIRYISRKQETDRWAFTPKRESGFISRFGHLRGLRKLPVPRHLELLPFVLAKQQWEAATDLQDRSARLRFNGGLDLKYGLSNNFTIYATLNPDFGQVEADPAVLNLTTYETFYPEKRPFFIEGIQIVRFTTFGDEGAGPGLFYSRRIGRAIQESEVSVPAGGKIEELPQRVTILGAAKLTGKTNGGLSVGILQAITRKEEATVVDSNGTRSVQVVEPFAHYSVIRLRQDVLDGSNVGMIITSVVKQSRLPALTGGWDWNLRFDRNLYQLDGFVALSHTTDVDSSRISGSAGRVQIARIGAEHWLWFLSGDYTTPHYNINDVGYFRRPSDWGVIGQVTFKEDVPSQAVRNYNVGLMLHEREVFEGVNINREASLEGSLLFTNYWSLQGSANTDAGKYDDRETRGNGFYAKPSSYTLHAALGTDTRYDVKVAWQNTFGWDALQKHLYDTQLGVELRTVTWMNWQFAIGYHRVRMQEAWVENVESGTITSSIFGDRSTDEYNVTLRGTVTFTPELTLQVYTQLFLARGHYENPRVLSGTSLFLPSAFSTSPDFNEQSLNANVVLRWEYLPGSTLFLVWSHARSGGNQDYFSSFGGNVGDTFRLPASNVLLLKMTYWMSV
jgi:hypothetical protein